MAIDVGRAQFQRRADSGNRSQHISPVGLGLGLQAAATQDPRKAFADAKRTLEPGGFQPVGLARIERQRSPRRAGEMTEDFGQAAAGNVKGLD
ncbi:hypothetical protein D3C76_1452860 [compost metagenome]